MLAWNDTGHNRIMILIFFFYPAQLSQRWKARIQNPILNTTFHCVQAYTGGGTEWTKGVRAPTKFYLHQAHVSGIHDHPIGEKAMRPSQLPQDHKQIQDEKVLCL